MQRSSQLPDAGTSAICLENCTRKKAPLPSQPPLHSAQGRGGGVRGGASFVPHPTPRVFRHQGAFHPSRTAQGGTHSGLTVSIASPACCSACCDASHGRLPTPSRPLMSGGGVSSGIRDTEGADHGLPPQGSHPYAVSHLRGGPRWGDGAEAVGLLSPHGLVEKAEVH